MKTKILIIMIMTIFALSCSKNNPVSPSSNTSALQENNNQDSTKNTLSDNKNTKEVNISSENKEEYELDFKEPLTVFEGEGYYKINGLGNDKENVKVEIYEDCIEITRTHKFFRFEIEKPQDEYNLEKHYNGQRHTLEMKITGDKASLTYTIQDQNENYSLKANDLAKR